jgi:DHA1 family bicyclomycin/chloramphenicol resistance-like MFS transporter
MELLVPSLPSLRLYFAVSEGQVQQLLSANFLGFIIGVFFAGSLCDSLGRKKVGLYGTVLFLLASLGAVYADSFSTLMFARFLQGVTVTGPMIASMTMLLEITSGHAQVFWMSIASATVSFSMSIAPVVGAWINEAWSFRANLWAIFIMALLGAIPFLLFVPETLSKEKRSPVSMQSIVQSYLSILQNRSFMILAIAVSALPAAFWVYSGVSSLYMVEHLELNPAHFGRYQFLIVASFSLMSVSISFFHKRFGIKTYLRLGFYAMVIGLAGLLFMSLSKTESVLSSTIFMMFFVGGMVPINSLIYPVAINLLPQHLQGCAQSMVQVLRLTLASLGTMSLAVLYHGPFLPVAVILLLLFCLGTGLVAFSQKKKLAFLES